MLRRIILSRISAVAAALAFTVCAWAQAPAAKEESHIWPDQWGTMKRVSVQPITVSDKPVWDELGLDAAEAAVYQGAEGTMHGEAYRLADSTTALAAFYWQRPPGAEPSTYAKVAVETPKITLIAFGNYLLKFEGVKPKPEELGEYYVFLPRLSKAALPPLRLLMPQQGIVPNSERYIIGPATLKLFAPGIDAATVGFHLGAEAELAHYQVNGKPLELLIFAYPTPNMARQRTEAFRKAGNGMVKRSGPLVAVLPQPFAADAAEVLMSQVRYEANVTWDEPPGGNPKNSLVDMLLAIFSLTGLLLLACLGGGAVVALFFIRRQRSNPKHPLEEPMVVLHLDQDR